MLLADQEDDERSMQYDDGQYYQHQYGDEDMESEEGFGVHSARVASRSNVRSRGTKSLSTIEKARSSVGEPFSGVIVLSQHGSSW
jgi:hypothetical protein